MLIDENSTPPRDPTPFIATNDEWSEMHRKMPRMCRKEMQKAAAMYATLKTPSFHINVVGNGDRYFQRALVTSTSGNDVV
jgi:hypothetical protein